MSKPFRLESPRILESDRQSQIIDWLRVEQAMGRVSWFCRVNGGGVKTASQFIRFYALYLLGIEKRSKGYADIYGMLPSGRYFALEVKQPGEKATPEQSLFLATVMRGGGIAAVVYGFKDVEKILKTPAGGALTPAGSDGLLLPSKTPPQALPDLPTIRATKNRLAAAFAPVRTADH
jgi:hypothetical protein